MQYLRSMSILCCGLLLVSVTSFAAENYEGKELYSQVNIWYEKPTKILSTNYHVGGVIPAGTKVTIGDASKKALEFKDANGTEYRIICKLKHNNVPCDELPATWFGTTDPMAKGGKFEKFTKEEKEYVRAGYIREGMSREAVLMAYGYPPTIRTPNLDQAIWTYWKNKWVTEIARFDDKGKVVEHR